MSNNQLIKVNSALVKAASTKHHFIRKIMNELDYGLPKLIPYRKGDKWGFCDRNKKIVIECIYELNLHIVYELNSYMSQRYFENETEEVELNGKFGRVAKDGKIVVEFKYDKTYEFGNGLFKAIKNGKSSLIDKEGKVILSCLYDSFRRINDNLIIVTQNGRDKILKVKELQFYANWGYELQYIAKHNLVQMQLNGKYGLMELDGTDVLEIAYDKITYHGTHIIYEKNKYYGAVLTMGFT